MNRIKEILKEKGITQQELADKLGVTRISVVKTLAGNPSQETLEKIANALNVPMWQLFASPNEVQQTGNSLICPNRGTLLELQIKEYNPGSVSQRPNPKHIKYIIKKLLLNYVIRF